MGRRGIANPSLKWSQSVTQLTLHLLHLHIQNPYSRNALTYKSICPRRKSYFCLIWTAKELIRKQAMELLDDRRVKIVRPLIPYVCILVYSFYKLMLAQPSNFAWRTSPLIEGRPNCAWRSATSWGCHQRRRWPIARRCRPLFRARPGTGHYLRQSSQRVRRPGC